MAFFLSHHHSPINPSSCHPSHRNRSSFSLSTGFLPLCNTTSYLCHPSPATSSSIPHSSFFPLGIITVILCVILTLIFKIIYRMYIFAPLSPGSMQWQPESATTGSKHLFAPSLTALYSYSSLYAMITKIYE